MAQTVPTNILLIYTMVGQLLNATGVDAWEGVYWSSPNNPDFAGALSGYQGQLQNIRIDSIQQISNNAQFVVPTSPAGGDLTGTYPNPTIFAIDGYQLDSSFLNPGDGYGIVFNATTNMYSLQPGGAGGFVAGGDLQGSSTNQTVAFADNQTISFSGSNITFDGSNGTPTISVQGSTPGGNLLSFAGQQATGSNTGGSVAVIGGNSVSGESGSIFISPGQNGSGQQTGNVNISSNDGVISILADANNSGLSIASDGVQIFSADGNPVTLGNGTLVTLAVDTSANVMKLPQLAGHGDGYLAISNTGVVSFNAGGPSGVAWGGDLTGSTNSTQYVASLSGNNNAGGTLPIKTTTLQWESGLGAANTLNIASYTPTSSGNGATGADIHITSQAGQTTTQINMSGGPSGSIHIYSGAGGTGGTGGSNGSAGDVILGDGTNNTIDISPANRDITINSSRTINLEVNTNSFLEVIQSGVVMAGELLLQTNNVSSSHYTVDANFPFNDYYIFVSNAAATSITLPSLTFGRQLVFKDSAGVAGTDNITILPHSTEHIDGANSYVINTNYGSVTLACNGFNWFIVSKV